MEMLRQLHLAYARKVLLVFLLTFMEVTYADEVQTQSQSCQFEPENVSSPFITKATELVLKTKPQHLTVLDLGAGNGRNIKHLLEMGATVHAYDADPASIKLISKQFASFVNRKKLYVHQESFENITSLPRADMVIAWRSLSFMEKDQLLTFWKKIENALMPNGIFTGTFFGEQHKTKRPLSYTKLFRLNREEVFSLFKEFLIIDFQEEIEYDQEVSKAWGSDQFEHIYRIIAQKK